jgi:hypothetical protein
MLILHLTKANDFQKNHYSSALKRVICWQFCIQLHQGDVAPRDACQGIVHRSIVTTFIDFGVTCEYF